MVVPDAARFHSFVDDAVEWHRSGEERALRRLIRSSWSGVGHDVGAAYATLAERSGVLLDAIDRGALALPAAERDSVLRFSQRARRIRSIPQDVEDRELRALIAETFEVSAVGARCAQDEAESADAAEIELTDPVEPEPQRGVPPWQRHFSASALNAYAECARKWFYRYTCAAVEDRGSAASAYGTALHLALEDFHADFPRPVSRDRAAMRRRMRECVTWAFERNRDGFETTVEFELQVRRAQRTAQRYVEWLLVQEKEAPFEVLGREVATNLDLEGRTFVGFIDRLDRDERSGDIRVVDYKTGSIALSAREYCDKVRRFRDFQLPFYYWARTAAGDRVAQLALIPLKDALLDVRPIVLHVATDSAKRSRDNGAPHGTIGLDELQRSRARMIELSDMLASGEVRDFEPTQDATACTYCNYATACWRKPPSEGRRFGS
ncbi:MAG TPA: PD-(D/E)XK nuclease family protein [Candidatus Cybelea sp.]|nr:PD-(D/E)XK nuclease family protein [Candidatus Cybelea sp.]